MKRIQKWIAGMLALGMILALPGCGASAKATLAGPKVQLLENEAVCVEWTEPFRSTMGRFYTQTGDAVLLHEKDLCYSPLSLYFALALAGIGAEGDTQKEIYALLGADNTEVLLNDANLLYRSLYQDEKHSKVYLANSLWLNDTIPFLEEYTSRAAKDLFAESYYVNFSAGDAGEAITKWISDNTRGLLKPEVNVDALTAVVLVNTLYFKANWVDEFKENRTWEDPFYLESGEAVDCEFMHASRSGSTVAVEGYNLASIPFEGGLRMYFLLPDEGYSVDGLLEEVGLEGLMDEGEAVYRDVEWSIPKFAVESEMDLIPVLESLGVQQAFSDTQADFSAMCELEQVPGEIVYISQVKQGVNFLIDEQGAEAAAYTEIDMRCGSAAPPDETIVMNLNRPFLYWVQENSGETLFVGRCDHPAA